MFSSQRRFATAILSVVVLAAIASPALAGDKGKLRRENVTSIAQLVVMNCEECTPDENSIFCDGDGSGTVYNETWNVSWNGDGAFCWSGTFGTLLNQNFEDKTAYESEGVTAVGIDCPGNKLFYQQCILTAATALVLLIIGIVVCCSGTILGLFCCGCCKCCNEEDDESNWGMCKVLGKKCGCIKQDEHKLMLQENPALAREMERKKLAQNGMF